MKNKKVALGVSVLGLSAYLLSKYSVSVGLCTELDYICRSQFDSFEQTLFFFYFSLFFSLLTYFSPEKVFQSWWRFARITAPVILILVFIINLELHHDPAGEMQNIFDAPALWAMYIFFTLGSVVSVVIGWQKGK